MPTWMRRVANYDYDLSVDSVFNWGDPVIGVSRTFLSSNIRAGVPWANMSAYVNPEVDQLLNDAAIENDIEKRKEYYSNFQEIVNDELPIIWLVNYLGNTLYTSNLGNTPIGIWGAFAPMHETGWIK